jgi:hypothetical protein
MVTKGDLDTVMDLRLSSATEYERVIFGIPYVCMCGSLVAEQLIHVGIQSFIRRTSMLAEYEQSSSKNRDPSNGPQNIKLCSQNGSNNCD